MHRRWHIISPAEPSGREQWLRGLLLTVDVLQVALHISIIFVKSGKRIHSQSYFLKRAICKSSLCRRYSPIPLEVVQEDYTLLPPSYAPLSNQARRRLWLPWLHAIIVVWHCFHPKRVLCASTMLGIAPVRGEVWGWYPRNSVFQSSFSIQSCQFV